MYNKKSASASAKYTKSVYSETGPKSKSGPPAKRPKNYNYDAAAKADLEKNPSATGRVSAGTSKEIEKSFAPKRKEWQKQYAQGNMSKRAFKDSVASTLAPETKVKDKLPTPYKKKKQIKAKVKVYPGDSPFW